MRHLTEAEVVRAVSKATANKSTAATLIQIARAAGVPVERPQLARLQVQCQDLHAVGVLHAVFGPGRNSKVLFVSPLFTTENTEWGFYGTVSRSQFGSTRAECVAHFAAVCFELVTVHGLDAEHAVAFLDSRSGRHVADFMTDGDEFGTETPGWLAAEVLHFKRDLNLYR